MVYDLEIVLAVSLTQHYHQRLIDFKKYGLLNIKDKKILITLLPGPLHDLGELSDGWPTGVDIVVIKNTNDDVSRKTYAYFSNYKNQPDSVRWIAKFDDDSINDISNLIDNLDKEFDYKKDYYFVTEMMNNMPHPAPEEKLLKSLGYEKWFTNNKHLWHEHEGSILSQGAFKKIIENDSAQKLMKLRSEINGGVSDICLAAAARIAGVFPSEAYFLSKDPVIGQFSLFGGQISHIHYVSHDRNQPAFDFIVSHINSPMKEDDEFIKKLKSKEYIFGRKGDHNATVVSLEASHKINNSPHANESLWKIVHNQLNFYNTNGILSTRFDLLPFDHKDPKYAEGLFRLDPQTNIVHYLRALESTI